MTFGSFSTDTNDKRDKGNKVDTKYMLFNVCKINVLKTVYICGNVGSGDNYKSCEGSVVFQRNKSERRL